MNGHRVILLACLAILTAALCLAQDNAKKQGPDFSRQSLRMRDFKGKKLEGAIFDDADCFLALFNNAVLSKASFRRADLTSATCTQANMSGADLRDAKLQRAGLDANLSNANLEGQDLGQTSLRTADLRGANLRNVTAFGDITGADFRGADLRGATLLGSKDYSQSAKFTGAKYDKQTRWALGFDVEASGAVLTESALGSNPGAPLGDKKSFPDGGKLVDDGKPLAPNMPVGAPPEAIVKEALENHLWGPARTGTKQRYRYLEMQYAKPTERQIEVDVGKTKSVAVYGVRVVGIITIVFYDGAERSERKDQNFLFFKNDFDQWGFLFTGNNKAPE